MNDFLSAKVLWFIIGMVLMLAELLLPGLIVFFFGAGAWVTAICLFFFDIGINTQLAIFLLSSVFFLVTLRRLIRRKYSESKTGESARLEDEYIGKVATALEDFGADLPGKVSFKGVAWEAVSKESVRKGQQLVITGFESIKLFVEPLKTSHG